MFRLLDSQSPPNWLRSWLWIAASIAATYPRFGSAEQHWPQFRGPDANGIAQCSAPLQFGPDQNVRWSADCPPGQSSPCIWGNRIFLTAYTDQTKQLLVLCFDRESGEMLWKSAVEAAEVETFHRVSSPATGTPATDGERLYVYFGSVGLLAFDLDGREVWRVSLPLPGKPFGSGTSPVVAGDLVLLNRECPDSSFLLAVNRRSGEQVWRRKHRRLLGGRRDGYATPVVRDDEIIIHRPVGIFAYSIEDGSQLWSVRAQSEAASTPVVTDDAVFVCTWINSGEPDLRTEVPSFDDLVAQHDRDGDGRISKEEFPDTLAITQRPELNAKVGGNVRYKMFFQQLDVDKDGSLSSLEWKAMNFIMSFSMSGTHGVLGINRNSSGDILRSRVKWKESKSVPEVPSPLLYRERLYVVKNGGIVSCLNPETGDILFRKRVGAAGGYYASPVAANGRIYLASERGVVVVISASDELDVLARNRLQERIMATPAIVDDTLYIRTASKLYAFAQKDR